MSDHDGEAPEDHPAPAPAHALSQSSGDQTGGGGVGDIDALDAPEPSAEHPPPPYADLVVAAPRPDVAPSPPPPGPSSQAAGKTRRWGRVVLASLVALLILVFAPVLAFKVIPPPVTILMLERLAQGQGLHKAWRPLTAMAVSLPQAVIAAEDARFCEHEGFDFEAMEAAARANERAKANGSSKMRGGSTLSQQTAKNVFLWPGRDYVRKGLEAGYTVLIERVWGKRRIMEVYLNVVEWGPGVYGAEAASQRYFHKPAAVLSPVESARLAAILPSPLKWKAVNPGRYVTRRTRRIGANAALVRADDLAACIGR